MLNLPQEIVFRTKMKEKMIPQNYTAGRLYSSREQSTRRHTIIRRLARKALIKMEF